MKIVKGILSVILSIILAILVIAIVILHISNNTFLNEEYVVSSLTNSFYDGVYDEIKEYAEEYLAGTEFTGLNVEKIITEEKVKEDINTIISDAYNGKTTKLDTTEIEENLNSEISTILGKEATNLMQDTINEFIEQVCKEYETQLCGSSTSEFSEGINLVLEYVDKAMLGVEIGIVVCVILILLLSLPALNRAILKYGISLEISGLLLAVFGTGAQNLITEAGVSELGIDKLVINIFSTVLNYGYAFVGVGFVCIFASELFNRTQKKNKTTYYGADEGDDF